MSIALTTIEEFESDADKNLVQFTGHLLQQLYPGYLWGVRLIASPALIGFTLGELMQYGDCHQMVVHPRDCSTRHEFEQIVKRLGGELLERANLSRDESKNVQVLKRPDGFNEKFDETIRLSKMRINQDRRL